VEDLLADARIDVVVNLTPPRAAPELSADRVSGLTAPSGRKERENRHPERAGGHCPGQIPLSAAPWWLSAA
jgi:hypothetical protein